MSNFHDLPDEVILKILSYSEIEALISCGQVSKRIRRISQDNSLWVTVNLEKKTVKTELLEMILGKGCVILNITDSNITGNFSSNKKSQLRVLNLSQITPFTPAWAYCAEYIHVLEELLFSCCSLQYLAMDGLWLTPKMADSICKNGKTLQTLDLNECNFHIFSIRKSKYLQEMFECCQELKDINFNGVEGLCHDDVQVLAETIPPNIEELNLGSLDFVDDHIKVLLSRCKKVKKLSLQSIWITDKTLTNIKQFLNLTLEEFSFVEWFTTKTGLLQLKSMPRLKRLNFYNRFERDCEEIQKLKQHLPHLMIRTSYSWESLKRKYSLVTG